MYIYLILDNTNRGITVMVTNSEESKPLDPFVDISSYENKEQIKANPKNYKLENDQIVAFE